MWSIRGLPFFSECTVEYKLRIQDSLCRFSLPVDNFGTVVGENPTPYGILALWAVNSLSIVYWATLQIKIKIEINKDIMYTYMHHCFLSPQTYRL